MEKYLAYGPTLRVNSLQINQLKQIKLSDVKVNVPSLIKIGAVFGASLLLYKIFKIWLAKRKYRHIPGPPTPGIKGYFLGNAVEMIAVQKEGRVLADLLTEWNQKYGSTFKFMRAGQPIVFTSNKQAIKDILITKNFPKSPVSETIAYPFGERFVGEGILTDPDFDRWKHRRSIFNTGFHRHVLMEFVGQFNQKADILMEKLRSMADGKTVISLFPEINRATLDAIALIAFGMNLDSVNQVDSPFNSAISAILNSITRTITNPLTNRNLKLKKEIKQKIQFLRQVAKEKILERLAAMKNDEPIPNDILANILESSKDENINIEDMVDDFITFFVAGQETTANALAFTFLELGRNIEAYEKVREEVDRVLGQRTEITHQDMNDLKYCSAVFKEAMRIWPPVSQNSRRITEDMTIDGYHIPKNSWIIISTYVNARDENNYPDCMKFKPERFLKDNGEGDRAAYTYFPFSLGPRNCIGQNFAIFEGVVMIAKLFQRFDYKLDSCQSMAIVQDLTLRPKDGTKVVLSVRD